MVILNYIAIVVVLVTLAGIVYIVLKNLAKVKVLDIETVPEEQRAKVKERILMERMQRKATQGKKIIKKGVSPVTKGVRKFLGKYYKKILDLDKDLIKEKKQKKLAALTKENKIKELLNEARGLLNQENYHEAEKKYIEILGLDAYNVKAYKSLASLYLEKKELAQSLQTWEYLLKLEKRNSQTIEKRDELDRSVNVLDNAEGLADIYYNIGEVYFLMERLDLTQKNLLEVIKLSPNSPKYLDRLLEISILNNDKSLAVDIYKKLAQVNPDNQKLKEYEERIKEM